MVMVPKFVAVSALATIVVQKLASVLAPVITCRDLRNAMKNSTFFACSL